MSNALIRLGWAGVAASVLLAICFVLTGTPYVAPYTTEAWCAGLGGIVFLVIGELTKRMR